MTYNELIQQKEWWTKCNEILSRDHYTCRDCGCLGYHNGGNYIKLNSLEELDSILKGWLFNGMPLFKFWNNPHCAIPHPFKGIKCEKEQEDGDVKVYRLNLFLSTNKLFPSILQVPTRVMAISDNSIDSSVAIVYHLNNISQNIDSPNKKGSAYLFEFPNYFANEIYVNIEHTLAAIIDETPLEQYVINISYVNKLLSLRFPIGSLPLRGLNIHHTYYIEGRKPWEYDNEALVTLCEDCHKKRHETSRIPLYDSNKRLISNLIPCDRCGGSGYLPQYHHVEHGRCFKCGGEGVIIID